MSFCKRSLTLLCAFAVMALGVFSFSLPSFALAAPTVDVQPFFLSMPQLPDGYFDGDILANGDNYQISLDFSNLASTSSESGSYSGSSSGDALSQGNTDFSFTVSNPNEYWTWDQGSVYFEYDSGADGYIYPEPLTGYTWTSPNGTLVSSTPHGTITQGNSSGSIQGYASDYELSSSESGSTSSSGSTDYSGTVSGSLTSSKDNNQHYRFHTFSLILDTIYQTRYYWFIYDARLVLHSSYSSDGIVLTSSGTGSAYYLCFDLSGNFIFRNGLGSSNIFKSSSGRYWISNSFPPFVPTPPNDTLKFVPAVFGEQTLLFSYLNTIHSDLITIHSDLTSLTSSMQSAISNQTSTFQNMDAASGFDPTSVDNMLNYGSLESNYHAPSTDQLFSVSGGTYTDGMAFWRDRMNELLYYSGSPMLGLTTFVMTLGLAALVIGRRISGGGSA